MRMAMKFLIFAIVAFFHSEISFGQDSHQLNTNKDFTPSFVKTPPLNALDAPAAEEKPVHNNFTDKIAATLGFEKFALTGTGFNADLDYSKSVGISNELSYHPEEKHWDLWASLFYKNTFLTQLAGLTPKNIALTRAEISIGQNFHFEHFKIGPVFQLENTLTNETIPNPIEVKKKSFLGGLRFSSQKTITDLVSIEFHIQSLFQLVASAQNYSYGKVESGQKHKMGILLNVGSYFSGFEINNEITKYTSSVSRGTSNAKENKTSIMIPLGMRFDFL